MWQRESRILHDCLHKYGKRIVNRLMDHDLLGPQTMTAHCIYVNEQEMDLLKATDTMVVHNPESNMGNACGCSSNYENLPERCADRSWNGRIYT